MEQLLLFLEQVAITEKPEAAELLVLAADLDRHYVSFNEIEEWHGKLIGGGNVSKKRK